MNLLKNKTVWITGAGRGIGKAIAKAFAYEEAVLALSARNSAEIKTVCKSITNNSGEAYPFPCDVSNEEAVKMTVDRIDKSIGQIDILINNAGVGKFSPIGSTTSEDWDRMININLKGPFLCTKAVIEQMVKRKQGHIINIVSVAGIQPFRFSSAYCASKYGLMGLTAVTREEVRKQNVKVTAIIPGATDTPYWDNINGDFDRSKMIKPDDVANTVISVCKSSESTLVEDIILRPISGNL